MAEYRVKHMVAFDKSGAAVNIKHAERETEYFAHGGRVRLHPHQGDKIQWHFSTARGEVDPGIRAGQTSRIHDAVRDTLAGMVETLIDKNATDHRLYRLMEGSLPAGLDMPTAGVFTEERWTTPDGSGEWYVPDVSVRPDFQKDEQQTLIAFEVVYTHAPEGKRMDIAGRYHHPVIRIDISLDEENAFQALQEDDIDEDAGSLRKWIMANLGRMYVQKPMPRNLSIFDDLNLSYSRFEMLQMPWDDFLRAREDAFAEYERQKLDREERWREEERKRKLQIEAIEARTAEVKRQTSEMMSEDERLRADMEERRIREEALAREEAKAKAEEEKADAEWKRLMDAVADTVAKANQGDDKGALAAAGTSGAAGTITIRRASDGARLQEEPFGWVDDDD